jgi:hypothetical protein
VIAPVGVEARDETSAGVRCVLCVCALLTVLVRFCLRVEDVRVFEPVAERLAVDDRRGRVVEEVKTARHLTSVVRMNADKRAQV